MMVARRLRRCGAKALMLASAGGLPFACAPAHAQPSALPPPEMADMSQTRLAALDAEFARRVRAGEAAGYAYIIAREGRIVHRGATGVRVLGGAAMSEDTLFRIASMTKPVTAVAVLRLVEQGKLSLDDPVAQYLPEIGAMQVRLPDGSRRPPARPVKVRDLLTHLAGIGYRFDPDSPLGREYIAAAPFQTATSLAEATRIIAGLDLFFDPGTRFLYSYGLDVAGRLVEVVSGQSFDAFLRAEIFDPLAMHDTGFLVPADRQHRLAQVYGKAGDEGLAPRPGDVFGDPLNRATWPSGGAGLISTPRDYIRFAMMLEGGGSLEGVQVLSPASLAVMTADHMPRALRDKVAGTPLETTGLGLGVAVTLAPGQGGALSGKGDFGWGGYYDTQFFVSPEYGIAAVIMTQYEKAPGEPERDTLQAFKTLTLAAVRR
jgi:CubicO group peptidase (beta-lactamase class C family)